MCGKLKKFICAVLSVAVIAGSSSLFFAWNCYVQDEDDVYEVSETDCDGQLRDIGVPESVIDNMSSGLKEYISENLEPDAVYESYDSYVLPPEAVQSDFFQLRSLALSDDRIKVTVLCFAVTRQGEQQYEIFPSFEWLETNAVIRNDTFAFALYSGWEAVADTVPKMVIYLSNSSGRQQSISYEAIDASQYGYGFSVPSNNCFAAPGGYYEGYVMFYARKKVSTAKNTISVKYIHDTTRNASVSYGINIGVASVSVTGSSTELEVYARNMSLSY